MIEANNVGLLFQSSFLLAVDFRVTSEALLCDLTANETEAGQPFGSHIAFQRLDLPSF